MGEVIRRLRLIWWFARLTWNAAPLPKPQIELRDGGVCRVWHAIRGGAPGINQEIKPTWSAVHYFEPQGLQSGPNGMPIETVDLTPTERARRIAFALARAQRSKPPEDKPNG